jgi:hypothetical protein
MKRRKAIALTAIPAPNPSETAEVRDNAFCLAWESLINRTSQREGPEIGFREADSMFDEGKEPCGKRGRGRRDGERLP